jgi:hypothetical protein
MADVNFRLKDFSINQVGFREFFDVEGPLRPLFELDGEAVSLIAQANCPVESAADALRYRRRGGGSGEPVPGRLRDSIGYDLGSGDEGQIVVRVGSGEPYARRQEFTHPTQHGFLRKALAAVGGPHAIGPGRPKDIDLTPAEKREPSGLSRYWTQRRAAVKRGRYFGGTRIGGVRQ